MSRTAWCLREVGTQQHRLPDA